MWSDARARVSFAIQRLLRLLEESDCEAILSLPDPPFRAEGDDWIDWPTDELSLRPRALAIRSARALDPDLEFAIDAFLLRLGERVDACQDAEATGDLQTLHRRVGELALHCDALGFPALAQAAGEIQAACSDRNPSGIRKAVEELTETAQRVWRVYCSAI